jgi:hypothetical protein
MYKMYQRFLNISAIVLVAIFAAHDENQGEKARNWKPTPGECCGVDCKTIYSYYGDSLPKIGPNGDFSYFQVGDFIGNDATFSSNCCDGLTVNSNPFTKYAIGQGILDHVKLLLIGNTPFSVPSTGEITFNAIIKMEAFKVADNPFGVQVQDPNSDCRLATAAFNVFCLTLGLVFDFFITNTKVYALYERLDVSRGIYGPYAAYTFLIPVLNIVPNSRHLYTMGFNGEQKSVRWLVDGKEVYKVYNIGTLLSRQFMALDLGGQEEVIFPYTLHVGFGTFTLLDGYSPCNVVIPVLDGGSICQFPANEQGLTQLTTLGYELNPRNGVTPATFVFDGSNVADHIWGQGVVMQLEKIFVDVCQ